MRNCWIEIGRVEDIPRLGARTVETDDGPIAVFRTANDSIFAVHNRCPHKGGPLSEGIVSGRMVACPLHNWVIDLSSGQALPPDEGCVPCVPSRVLDGIISLELKTRLKVVNG